jgi:hypothetical protein
VIGYRHVDPRYPFLWESSEQPPARWHGAGEGPASYFADTPHGAWAEFLRHEEITDPEDLATIRRQMWAVQIDDASAVRVSLPEPVMTGGVDTYRRCQVEARALRKAGVRRIVAPSAALVRGGARGLRVDGGVHPAEPRDGTTIVLFGPAGDLRGWIAADAGRPSADLLSRVHHFDAKPGPGKPAKPN